MSRIDVSVVTVCYNCKDLIAKTIESVITQKSNNYEYIVIDGKSTDGTLSIIDKYKGYISLIVSEPDRGIYDAMNKALMYCKGNWIIFMNAGDCFDSNMVLSSIPFDAIALEPKNGIIYGKCKSMRKGKVFEDECLLPFTLNRRLLKPMGFHHQCTFVRTDLAKLYQFDDINFRLCADYNMISHISQDGFLIVRVPLCIAFVSDQGGVSSQNRLLQLKETAIICDCSDKPIYYIERMKLLIKKYIKQSWIWKLCIQ